MKLVILVEDIGVINIHLKIVNAIFNVIYFVYIYIMHGGEFNYPQKLFNEVMNDHLYILRFYKNQHFLNSKVLIWLNLRIRGVYLQN